MARETEITCEHCGVIVRVAEHGPFLGKDEPNWLPCPQCQKTLLSWERPAIYDVVGIVRQQPK